MFQYSICLPVLLSFTTDLNYSCTLFINVWYARIVDIPVYTLLTRQSRKCIKIDGNFNENVKSGRGGCEIIDFTSWFKTFIVLIFKPFGSEMDAL